MITVPAEGGTDGGIALLEGAEPAFFWTPPEGGTAAGYGAVETIRTSGKNRVEELRRRADRLFGSIETFCFPGTAPVSPALFGGLAFAGGNARREPWTEFGDCAFYLPRWIYREDGAGATLSCAFHGNDRDARARLLAEYERICRLCAGGVGAPVRIDSGDAALRQMEETRWIEMVETIRDAIASGEFTKIVAARLTEAKLDFPIDIPTLLSRLAGAYPECYRFAFRPGRSTFLGATPERLVRKEGRIVRTEALAGSIGVKNDIGKPGRREPADVLMGSAKDRAEHAIVVDSIRRRLTPLSAALEIPDRPRVVKLRHVMHLHTPIAAELSERRHVLDLLSVLHPTPSVGGVPTEKAIEWIVRNEPDPRGWYAGPVGWFDGAGDGEFAVALRCGLVRGKSTWLYAGAGIVHDSDPSMEFAETDIKQQAFLRALGIRV